MGTLITVIYDNELYNKELKSGWGFSCLVEKYGKKVLFDTGDNGLKLLSNMERLNIEPKEIKQLVLSHDHWDHTGGLEEIIKINNELTMYFGNSFPQSFRKRLSVIGMKFLPVDEMISLGEGIWVGPEMDGFVPKEIPFIVEAKMGIIVITGCAHPGIVKMVEEVKKTLNKKIHMVLGGFHLGYSSGLKTIVSDLKRLGVKKAGPCHCSGETAIRLFEEKFKKNFIKIGAGSKIELE